MRLRDMVDESLSATHIMRPAPNDKISAVSLRHIGDQFNRHDTLR